MKRPLSTTPLFLFVTLLAGCVSSKAGLDPSLAGEIPKDANVIRIYSEEAPADLYRAVYQLLATRGYEIKEHNAEMMTVSTEFNEVGQETLLAVRALVEPDAEGSVATLRGRWNAGQSIAMFSSMMAGVSTDQLQGQPAAWKGSNRAGVAFGQMAKLAKELPGRLAYEVE